MKVNFTVGVNDLSYDRFSDHSIKNNIAKNAQIAGKPVE